MARSVLAVPALSGCFWRAKCKHACRTCCFEAVSCSPRTSNSAGKRITLTGACSLHCCRVKQKPYCFQSECQDSSSANLPQWIFHFRGSPGFPAPPQSTSRFASPRRQSAATTLLTETRRTNPRNLKIRCILQMYSVCSYFSKNKKNQTIFIKTTSILICLPISFSCCFVWRVFPFLALFHGAHCRLPTPPSARDSTRAGEQQSASLG